MWSRLHVRWGNLPHVTSHTWGPPPSCKQALKHVVQQVVWTASKTRSLEYFISIVLPTEIINCPFWLCCLKNDDQIFRNGKVGQVKLCKYIVNAHGFICNKSLKPSHLPVGIFLIVCFKTIIPNATAIRVHVANKWIDLSPLITAREERSYWRRVIATRHRGFWSNTGKNCRYITQP